MYKSILDMVHESAKDLHAAGVMKETTLREFDALCLPPVKIHCMGPNTKQWQENSDEWCRTMTKSKESKELYKKYQNRTRNPMSYVKWLKGKKYDTSNS